MRTETAKITSVNLAAAILCAGVALLASGCADSGVAQAESPATGAACTARVEHLNPAGLSSSPAYSQAVAVTGCGRTVYVGGQNAVDSAGQLIGKGDLEAQAGQVFRNVEAALAGGGAKLEHVVKWNIYVREGQPLELAFGAYQRAWANRAPPAAVSVLFVAGLALPDALLEVDAVAVVPSTTQ
jgi:enamine deaminase RidA (YjgF/YER057c/UK114 family)